MALAWLAPGVASAQMRTTETAHYIVHTDVDPELAQDLARRMDSMYDEYARRLVEFAPPQDGKRFEVYIYRRRADYLNFTNNRYPNTGGMFMSGRNTLAAVLEGQGRDALRRTLQHEAFHQFAFTAIGPNLPIWVNEGLAQVFEEGIFNGQQFWLGQVPPRRLRQLEADMAARRLLDFPTLLAMSDDQWNEGLADKLKAATQYSQAWAMTHFLVFAPDADGNPRYRSRLIDMLRAVHTNGAEGMPAFTGAFGDNIAGFQRRFVEYANQLTATPQATYIEHQDVLADMLTELRSRGHQFTTLGAFRQKVIDGGYRIEYTKGQVRWNTDRDAQVYFSDLSGRAFDSARLYLDPRPGAPIPDLVSKPVPGMTLRTRFTGDSAHVEHELLVEPN
jgi:hypothetical protein